MLPGLAACHPPPREGGRPLVARTYAPYREKACPHVKMTNALDVSLALAEPLWRRAEPLASGEGKAAGFVFALPDCDDLVDGEVSVLEGERGRGEVEQPRPCS